VTFVALALPATEQERRLANSDRAQFEKLRSIELLRQLRPDFERCLAAMPPAAITIDTFSMPAEDAAARILAGMRGEGRAR